MEINLNKTLIIFQERKHFMKKMIINLQKRINKQTIVQGFLAMRRALVAYNQNQIVVVSVN